MLLPEPVYVHPVLILTWEDHQQSSRIKTILNVLPKTPASTDAVISPQQPAPFQPPALLQPLVPLQPLAPLHPPAPIHLPILAHRQSIPALVQSTREGKSQASPLRLQVIAP